MSDVKFSQKGGERGDETKVTFISGNQKTVSDQREGCCYKKGTGYCCWVTLALGCLLLILGLVALIAGNSLLTKAILKTMALKPGSDRLQSWLTPPVQPHLEGYGFSVLNPEEVIQGGKPKLEEVGPFIYKAVTVKDSVDHATGHVNLQYDEDGETLTYKPRKFYTIDLEKSFADPDKTFITVPNIPFLSGMSKIRDYSGWKKGVGASLITKTGLGTPFINVSFSGLLWGYNDELPCNSHPIPDQCVSDEIGIFGNNEDESDDGWGDDDGDGWGDDDDDWKRKKREVRARQKRSAEQQGTDWRTLDHDKLTKEKAAIVDCKCEWGLFRDRNVTLRKPVTINHGMSDLSKKGWVSKFDGSSELNWWAPGSHCDKVGGQDGGTLYPGAKKTDNIQMFISLMCRKIGLNYEKDVQYGELNSLRFVPPPNALGSADDSDPVMRNTDNKCYCLKGFDCFKSGVLNMAPCKISENLPAGAPIALSYPHFYQADPHYLSAVEGLQPDKEKHEFYVDIAPEFGFPLAIRPRFQLNVVIKRDQDIEIMRNFNEELVLPFLWAQDGFSAPSEEMSQAIKFGLEAPAKLSLLGGITLIVLGASLVLAALVWLMVTRRNSSGLTFPSPGR